MSDKCATGTGRFLDIIADALGYKVEDLGGISLKSTNKVTISKTCTVFARQEVVTRLSEGVLLEDIVAGIHDAIAGRITSMVARLKTGDDVLLTGGVAKNIGVVKALERNLGCPVLVPEEPLLSGAIGAALLGKEIVLNAQIRNERVHREKRCLDEVTFFT